jgi:type IV pilus assembly protein PilW
MNKQFANPSREDSRARGFSMVELMVAIAVSAFLLVGLFSIMQSTRKTSDNERLLAQLQDNQRIAMSLLTTVVEATGFYSNALTVAQTDALPVAPNFAQQGQSVSGSQDANGNDFFYARFQTDGTDGLLSCLGPSTTVGVYVTKFSLIADPAATGTYQLVCAVNGGADVPLVKGLTRMQVFYGTGTSLTAANSAGAADAYLTAAQVGTNPMFWTNVFSMRVILTFKNPLASQPGQTKATIDFGRVINIKSRSGVNVVNYT